MKWPSSNASASRNSLSTSSSVMAAPIGGARQRLQQFVDRRLRARKPPPIRPPIQGGPVAVLQSPTQVTGVKMKLIAWAIALAAAGLTPAAAQAPQAAQPTAQTASEASAPAVESPVRRIPPAVTADRDRRSAMPSPTSSIGVPIRAAPASRSRSRRSARAPPTSTTSGCWCCASIISLFVLGLLGYTIIRFRRGANPTPSRTSHNTALEVVWTLVPVLILVAIAIPSIRLLSNQYSPPPGRPHRQGHRQPVVSGPTHYPDNGGFEIVSNMLKEKKRREAGRALPHRRRRPAAARGRRADGHSGRQGREVPRHLERRDPRLLRCRPSGARSTPTRAR